jgi:hypothetical protein
MGAADARQVGKGADMRQDHLGEFGMALHRPPFRVVELAGLVEHAVGNAELADIVQQGGAAQEPALPFVDPHLLGDQVGKQRHAVAMA